MQQLIIKKRYVETYKLTKIIIEYEEGEANAFGMKSNFWIMISSYGNIDIEIWNNKNDEHDPYYFSFQTAEIETFFEDNFDTIFSFGKLKKQQS